MKNPFKKLGKPEKEVPEELKQDVFEDIAAFKVFLEIASLFSSNYANTVKSFFEKRNKTKN